MKIINNVHAMKNFHGNLMVALGNFDGVHLGHQKLINEMVRKAREKNCKSAVLTFIPHPLQFLRPEKAPKLLLNKNRKVDLIERLGVDVLFIIPFNWHFAALSPNEFVEDILIDKLGVKGVFVGFNYRFGRRGKGNPDLLEHYSRQNGFLLKVLMPVNINGVTVSSTMIRNALQEGLINRACDFLGYSPLLEGRVTTGDQRGRDLGFPTANLKPDPNLLVPKKGVYAAKVKVNDQLLDGLVNIGLVPTFTDKNEISIEVHILDFKEDIYGKRISLHLLSRLRDEKKFNKTTELINQIKLDIKKARKITSSNKLDCIV